MEYINKRGDTS